MALDSYSGLKTAIESYLERDLTDNVDDFIDLAEVRHKRDIKLREQIVREPIVIVNRYRALPHRFNSAISIRLMTEPVTPLQHVEQEALDLMRLDTPNRPLAFAIGQQIEFDTEPDQNYSAEILYYQTVLPLSDTNTTNSILQAAPDAYLYGALSAAGPWLMHDERVQVWEGLYQSAITSIGEFQTRKVGTPIARVPGYRGLP